MTDLVRLATTNLSQLPRTCLAVLVIVSRRTNKNFVFIAVNAIDVNSMKPTPIITKIQTSTNHFSVKLNPLLFTSYI